MAQTEYERQMAEVDRIVNELYEMGEEAKRINHERLIKYNSDDYWNNEEDVSTPAPAGKEASDVATIITPDEDSQFYKKDKPKTVKPKIPDPVPDPNVVFEPGSIPVTEATPDPNKSSYPNFNGCVEPDNAAKAQISDEHKAWPNFGNLVDRAAEAEVSPKATANTHDDTFTIINNIANNLGFVVYYEPCISEESKVIYSACFYNANGRFSAIAVDNDGAIYNNVSKFWTIDNGGSKLDSCIAFPIYDKQGNVNQDLIVSAIMGQRLDPRCACYKDKAIILNSFINCASINSNKSIRPAMKTIWNAFNAGKLNKFTASTTAIYSRFEIVQYQDQNHFKLHNGFSRFFGISNPSTNYNDVYIVFDGNNVSIISNGVDVTNEE